MTALAATTATAAEPPKVEIVGHRGASFDAPENTVAAIKLAWEQKADASEFDVYLTKDGKLVVIHDSTTKRTTGTDLKVAGTTLEELRKLDAGKWKGEKFSGEKLPTLEEMLATVPTGKRVFIEIKCGPEAVPEMDRVLNASKLKPEQACVISFNADVVAASKKLRPDLQALWIVSLSTKGKPKTAEELIAKAKEIKADGLDLSATPAVLDKAFGDKVKAAGLKLYVWTVDDVELARKMIAAGVESITTNRPGWLREQLAK
ncbi:MAG: glycerophosphodiester phosphodiesterase [Planctomycetes bacterium]|nr:glycerophosphodiester phosphodiesterase [Planctomycetota bacterium]